MRTTVCALSKDPTCLSSVLSEVDKAAVYNGLDSKSAFRLRLLAEELCGMLPGLIKNFNGQFWMENDQNKYELHTELYADSIDIMTKDSLIRLSSSGKNEAEKSFMGKISNMVQDMLLNRVDTALVPDDYDTLMESAGGDVALMAELGSMHTAWSMQQYRTAAENGKYRAVLEDMEQSIVAKLADDILVGVRGKNVEIIVKKTF